MAQARLEKDLPMTPRLETCLTLLEQADRLLLEQGERLLAAHLATVIGMLSERLESADA